MHRKLIVDLCTLPHSEEVTAEWLTEALSDMFCAAPGEVQVTEAYTLGEHN